MRHKIGIAIPYNSNDYKFFRPNILQIKKFAKEIVVVYTDHFFSGKPENMSIIKRSVRENPEAKFVGVKYYRVKPPIPDFICRFIPRTGNLRPLYGPQYWACYSRWVAFQNLRSKVDYILFLDADEIVDASYFIDWLNTGEYCSFEAVVFSCYYYFRSPRYQAKTWQTCGLLVKNIPFKFKDFMSYYERRSLFHKTPGPKKDGVLGLNNKPMLHHYGWARNKKEMLQKVRTWGHSQEKNWESLVKKEFSHPFNGTDFLRHYQYRTVKPFVKFSKI